MTWTSTVAPAAAWLTLTPSNGMVQGTGQSGSIGVAPNIAGLPVGTYSTQVTIAASDASGATVQGSPQSFMVTLTVTGYTVSGTVFACPGSTPPTCVAPQALPGATVTLLSGSNTVATTKADASGNFAFSNIALGSYTISVAGSDASNTHYVGSLALTLTGNAISLTVQTFPG
jgi:carboxypeptidase family protein